MLHVLKVLGREPSMLGQMLLTQILLLSRLPDSFPETFHRKNHFWRGARIGAIVPASFAAGARHSRKQAPMPD